jgi:hypothetical protein
MIATVSDKQEIIIKEEDQLYCCRWYQFYPITPSRLKNLMENHTSFPMV